MPVESPDADREPVPPLNGILERSVHTSSISTGFAGQLMEGFRAPVVGLQIALSRPKYLRAFATPVLIQSVISLGLIGILTGLGWILSGWLQKLIKWIFAYISTDNSNPMVQQITEIVIFVILIMLLFYVFSMTWRLTGGILGDHFGDKLTNKVMSDLGLPTRGAPPSAISTLSKTMRQFVMAHLAMLACAPIGIIPIIGGLCVLLVGASVMAYLSGADELADPLQNLGLEKQQIKTLCRKYRLTVVGLAASKNVLAPVPVVGGLTVAAESIGRIILALRLIETDEALSQAVYAGLNPERSAE